MAINIWHRNSPSQRFCTIVGAGLTELGRHEPEIAFHQIRHYTTSVHDYYSDKLSADRLRRCYALAPPRVQQYLVAEIDHTLNQIQRNSVVLELGCGYGRVLEPLTAKAGTVVGIDISLSSLVLAREFLPATADYFLACMDASRLAFHDQTFDAVICIQNGISAFHLDQRGLIEESLRVTKSGGQALFSTYSSRFWDDRMAWFELQAEAGLIGEIDREQTGSGNIVCKDGFTASTISREELSDLAAGLGATVELIEVDDSSIFCHLTREVPR